MSGGAVFGACAVVGVAVFAARAAVFDRAAVSVAEAVAVRTVVPAALGTLPEVAVVFAACTVEPVVILRAYQRIFCAW